MDKVIMVLLDACQYEAGTRNLGFMEGLTEHGQAAKYKVRGELPSISKSIYGTLFTGLPVYQHGAVCNERFSIIKDDNVFSLCKAAGGVTAAASWCWMSELYNGLHFDPMKDRLQLDAQGSISHGIYYWQDEYPDEAVYADGEFLRLQYQPDFLLVHPMGIDNWGHIKGAQSSEYERAIAANSNLIARLIPDWLAAGYQVVVTADHGMNQLGLHGGSDAAQRDVPLYIVSPKVKAVRQTDDYISQFEIAPMLCRLLGVPAAKHMRGESQILWK